MRGFAEGFASESRVAAVDLSCRTSWATSRVGQAASVEQIEPSRRSTKSLVIESLRHQRRLAALQKRCLQRMHVLLEQEQKGRLGFLTPRSNALYVERMQGLYGKKPKTTRTSFTQHIGYVTGFLAAVASFVLVCVLCGRAASAASSFQSSSSQAPPSVGPPRMHASPVTNVTVDGSEAMFTTMCALLAAGFESDVSAANWHPLRAQLRDRMQHQQGPAVDALREFYKKHELADAGAMLSQYIWFGLVSGPPPKFTPTLRRDELPPEVITLEGFSEILSAYYVEQHIGRLWVQVQPVYNHEIDGIHDSVSQIVFVATNYLRELASPGDPRTFTIIV